MAVTQTIVPTRSHTVGSSVAGDDVPSGKPIRRPPVDQEGGSQTSGGDRDREDELGARLVADGKIRTSDLARIQRMQASLPGGRALSDLLVSLGLVAETDMAVALAGILDMPMAKKDDLLQAVAAPGNLSKRFLVEHIAVPVAADKETIRLVMANPLDDYAVHAVRIACGRRVERWVGVPSEIQQAIEELFGEGNSELNQIVSNANVTDDMDNIDVQQLRDMASEAPVIRLVNLLMQRATEALASDIHIEPFDGHLKVRCRIDGVLQEMEAPPPRLAAAVVSRIKLMARLNIAERRLPQDGRVKLQMQGAQFDIRISTVPTMHGESVVMRLLNRGDVAFDPGALGFDAAMQRSLRKVLELSHGMILVTGPTGSGKTTTLYTAMNILNTEARKIITAEDPVEYQIEGINQIQVNPAIGLTFANVLRSIVRQDPDVILVGEMRDLETARICVQSALTGHLVLSTLHTNSAASSITRLLEMGIEDYLVTSTLNAVISQRLVRVLCPHCREPYRPQPELMAELRVERPAGSDPVLLYRAGGCDACNGTGYRGRRAILEMLLMNDAIRSAIAGQADARQIEAAALQQGMVTTYQDGVSKALAGITSMEEVLRVIQGM